MKATICRTLILAVAFIMFTANASAQPPCNQRDHIVTWLGATYKEVPVAFGVNGKGDLVEVLSSQDGFTWTIIVTSPDGLSCVVSVGEGWRSIQLGKDLAEPQA